MRLSKKQITEIIYAINNFGFLKVDIYLFGSRTNSELRGGDIDLLIIGEKETLSSLLKQKHKIINKIQSMKNIDDMRVDLTFGSEEDFKTDPFISTLNESKIKISG